MPKMRFKWNPAAFAEVRTSPAMMGAVEQAAQGIADRANSGLEILPGSNGDGYVATPTHITGGKRRARATVVTGDISAIVDEARNHTLERSL